MTPANKEPITLPNVENEIQVRFSDTDAMGHISSGSYAAFAEVGQPIGGSRTAVRCTALSA